MKRKAFLGIFILILGLSLALLYLHKRNSKEEIPKDYKLILSLEEGDTKLKLYAKDGIIDVGKNKILVEMEPRKRIESLYFYMPPMPGMGEMREDAILKEIKAGFYEGFVNLSMAGSWQLIVQVDGKTIRRDLSIPLGGEEKRDMGEGSIRVSGEKLNLIGIQTQEVKREELTLSFISVGYVSYDTSKVYEITLRSDAWVLDTFDRFEGELIGVGTPLMKVLSPDVEIAKAELDLAKKVGEKKLEELVLQRLSYIKEGEVIKSPYSGVILERKAFKGGFLKAGDMAYRIGDVSSLWVIAEVPQVYSEYVRKGIRVMVLPVGSKDTIFGKVSYIFPEADKESRTLRVRIDLPKGLGTLKVNQMVEVYFEKPLGEVLAIPESAVVDTGRRQVVFVEKDIGVYEPRIVKLGRKVEGYYEVLDGLKEGEKVVVKGTFLLDSEAQLKGIYGEVKIHEHHHH